MAEYLFMGEQSHLKQNSSSFLQTNMASLDYTSKHKAASLEHVCSIFPTFSSCAIIGVRLQRQLMAHRVFTAAFNLFTAVFPWKRVLFIILASRPFTFSHIQNYIKILTFAWVIHAVTFNTLAHLLQNTKSSAHTRWWRHKPRILGVGMRRSACNQSSGMCTAMDRETSENVGEVDSGHLCVMTEKCVMLLFPFISVNVGNICKLSLSLCALQYSERSLCSYLLSMPVS